MDYEKIEKIFVQHLIGLIGPNKENDELRETKFQQVKNLITTAIKEENNNKVIPHIFCYGSFPQKTYLQDSDLDITIMFEDKEKKNLIQNDSFEFLHK